MAVGDLNGSFYERVFTVAGYGRNGGYVDDYNASDGVGAGYQQRKDALGKLMKVAMRLTSNYKHSPSFLFSS
jgi:hypothetical protein